MGDTEGMARPGRLSDPRKLRRDLTGDAVLTLIAGGVLLAAVFLPWVNEDVPGWVNFSLSQGGGLNGVLDTAWGAPALILPLVVLVAGASMLLFRPRRFSVLIGALVAVCGVAAFGVAQDAAASIGFYDPGLGLYLTSLAAILLVPIGVAAALVAGLSVRAESSAGERAGAGRHSGRRASSPASSRKRSTELIGTPSSSAILNLAAIALGSPGCRLQWSRIRPRPFSPRICSIA